MLAVRLLGVGPPTDASESMTLQGVALKTYVDDELKYLIGIFLMPPVLILGSLLTIARTQPKPLLRGSYSAG